MISISTLIQLMHMELVQMGLIYGLCHNFRNQIYFEMSHFSSSAIQFGETLLSVILGGFTLVVE